MVDNADNDADFVAGNSEISQYIPHGAKGTVIYTTRSLTVALQQGCEMVEVGNMDQEEALELFSRRYGGWSVLERVEKAIVPTILDSLGHLPLAVVGCAALMMATDNNVRRSFGYAANGFVAGVVKRDRYGIGGTVGT